MTHALAKTVAVAEPGRNIWVHASAKIAAVAEPAKNIWTNGDTSRTALLTAPHAADKPVPAGGGDVDDDAVLGTQTCAADWVGVD